MFVANDWTHVSRSKTLCCFLYKTASLKLPFWSQKGIEFGAPGLFVAEILNAHHHPHATPIAGPCHRFWLMDVSFCTCVPFLWWDRENPLHSHQSSFLEAMCWDIWRTPRPTEYYGWMRIRINSYMQHHRDFGVFSHILVYPDNCTIRPVLGTVPVCNCCVVQQSHSKHQLPMEYICLETAPDNSCCMSSRQKGSGCFSPNRSWCITAGRLLMVSIKRASVVGKPVSEPRNK